MPMGLLGFFFIINLKSMCLFDVFVFRLVSMSFFFWRYCLQIDNAGEFPHGGYQVVLRGKTGVWGGEVILLISEPPNPGPILPAQLTVMAALTTTHWPDKPRTPVSSHLIGGWQQIAAHDWMMTLWRHWVMWLKVSVVVEAVVMARRMAGFGVEISWWYRLVVGQCQVGGRVVGYTRAVGVWAALLSHHEWISVDIEVWTADIQTDSGLFSGLHTVTCVSVSLSVTRCLSVCLAG